MGEGSIFTSRTLRDICVCLTMAAAFIYASAFYSTIVYLDEIGVRGMDIRLEDFVVFSAIAILIVAIVISITSFFSSIWLRLLHFFFDTAMLIVICYSLIATFWAKNHILSVIQDKVLRLNALQKQNSCINWYGHSDYLEVVNNQQFRPCGEVFDEYFNRKASSNSIMLAISAVISSLSVIISGILCINDENYNSCLIKSRISF